MKEVILLVVTLAMFAFVYVLIMKKIDPFIKKSRHFTDVPNMESGCTIRIGLESHALRGAIAPALKQCSEMNPFVQCVFSYGKRGRLLKKLTKGSIDIAILYEDNRKELEKGLAQIRIPYQIGQDMNWCYVAWKKSMSHKDRDRVLFYIENEHCRLKSGYCDYMN
ncbi:MAG: hypothetical protein E7246_07110 [Lachnoclostridium sp.]|nr:hypothetical protein [Lachnoclostridium sp.]